MFAAAAAKRTALAAASIAALLAVAIVGPAGGAPKGMHGKGLRDKIAPTAPANPHVVRATPSLVYVAWDPSSDNVGVAGYFVYGDGRPAVASSSSFVVSTLDCGREHAVHRSRLRSLRKPLVSRHDDGGDGRVP